MMSMKARLFTPVSALSLDELVPADHFYRHLDQVLDLTFVRELVQERYADTGRPGIDPVVFFKLQLVLFFEDLRSEWLLMRTVADRLSVRWYLGYNLDEPLPDHSSLTRIRTRYGLEIFRRFFEAIVEQCQQAGLVWGKELYFDATHVQANAALDSLTPRFAVAARAAIQAHLAALFPHEGVQQEEPEAAAAASEPPAPGAGEGEASAGGGVATPPPEPTSLPVARSAALRADLEAANAARHDWIAEEGRQQRAVHGAYQRTADFLVSTTDPDATPMHLKGGGTHLGYQTHYVVDGGKRRIIVGVLVTPGEVMENQPMLDLLWRSRFRWHLWPRQVTGDTTYGTLENIVAVEQEHIRADVPLPDFDHRPPFYGKDRFRYDPERDRYTCPQGATLRPVAVSYPQRTVRYKARPTVCRACSCRAEGTTNPAGRVVVRQFEEAYLDQVRVYHQTEAYHKARRTRQVWVEPLFAEAKEWHKMRRFRHDHGIEGTHAILIFGDPWTTWRTDAFEPVERCADLITQWCAVVGHMPACFRALIRLLSTVGFSLFVSRGAAWLSACLSDDTAAAALLREESIAQSLAELLVKAYRKHGSTLRSSGETWRSFNAIVDRLVSAGEPAAAVLQARIRTRS